MSKSEAYYNQRDKIKDDSDLFFYHYSNLAPEKYLVNEYLKQNPNKKFYLASEKLVCPNMKKNTLEKVRDCLKYGLNKVELDDEFMAKAK